jgi:hypothetical protein
MAEPKFTTTFRNELRWYEQFRTFNMIERSEADIKNVTTEIESSLRLARDGMIDAALLALENAEMVTGDLSIRADGSGFESNRQILCWLLLVRANFLVDLGRPSEAEPLLESILEMAGMNSEGELVPDRTEQMPQEIARASLILARAAGYQGQFNRAILTLVRASKTIRGRSPADLEGYLDELSYRIDEYGSVLGYESLSRKLVGSVERETSAQGRIEREKFVYPIPLSGTAEAFKHRYNALREKIFERGALTPEEKSETLLQALEVVNEWSNHAPYSVEARSVHIELNLTLAMALVQTDRLEDFDGLFFQIEQEIEAPLTEAPEVVDAKRNIANWLYSLGRVILTREYKDQETRAKFFLLGARCLSGAYETLDDLRSSGRVTQAVALSACYVSQLIAKLNDMVGQPDLANSHRLRRDRILSEVLRRDPKNDRALRIFEHYLATPPQSPSSEHPEISDVSTWEWSIDRLV